MSIFLIETKNEYTTRLTNILAPLVFEGFTSIYKDALKIANENDVLKIFQTCLKAIPKWNQDLINKETSRILSESNSVEWLEKLIKATIKANIIVLTYNPYLKTQPQVKQEDYNNINTASFIHMVYIECAREFYNNPYLLYHIYPPIDIKRNQRESLNLIKECIKEALRKLLPYKHILNIYLGEGEIPTQEYRVENIMTELETKNLKDMCDRDLNLEEIKVKESIEKPIMLEFTGNQTQFGGDETKIDTPKPGQVTLNEDESIGDKVLKIIHGGENKNDTTTIDDKIKNALHALSTNETIMDSETSLVSENKYLDVFANTNTGNNVNKKYFNNYMKI